MDAPDLRHQCCRLLHHLQVLACDLLKLEGVKVVQLDLWKAEAEESTKHETCHTFLALDTPQTMGETMEIATPYTVESDLPRT